jgi:hypothetical protein
VADAVVKCHCCDTQFLFPMEILTKIKLPATFCRRCFDEFPYLLLRKFFVLDMLYHQVQAHEAHLQTGVR